MPVNQAHSRTSTSIDRKRLRRHSGSIANLLSRLRNRIRRAVLIEGLAAAVACGVGIFWVAFLLDYGPVMFGFSELSRTSRGLVLLLAGAALTWLLFRLIGRRILVPLPDRSMAILVERKYPEFNDSLLTTVTRIETLSDASAALEHGESSKMLERTRVHAEALVGQVDLGSVISTRPMRNSLVMAAVMSLSVVFFAVATPAAAKLASQRLVLLSSQLWPRRCQLEIVGIKTKREEAIEGIAEMGQTLEPVDGVFKVAKGSTLALFVKAESGPDGSRLPPSCELNYWSSEGSGATVFKKIGAPRDGYQLYSVDGDPFRGILNTVSFNVRGGDHRIGPFEVAVVDEPYVERTELNVKYPNYLAAEKSLRWTDRKIPWTGQAKLQEGTAVMIEAVANKPISKVYVRDEVAGTMSELPAEEKRFTFPLPPLMDDVSLKFYLCDTDGLVSSQPHVIRIEPIEDQPPVVSTILNGIGTAVTPDVQLPIGGEIKDDYGLKKTWLEIAVDEFEPIVEPLTVVGEGQLETVIDFRSRRQQQGNAYELPTAEGSVLSLVIKSEDQFDLSGAAHVGVGDRYELDIVTPDRLLRLLERNEVGQRRRLEQIYLELADARNYLSRAKSKESSASSDIVEPGDSRDEQPSGEVSAEEASDGIPRRELQLLFCQRALLQVDKSRLEIVGCADAFENIRLQLINNRVDSEDRKQRFADQIIGPLMIIGEQSLPELKRLTQLLEETLRQLQLSPTDTAIVEQADEQAAVAIEQTFLVLRQLDQVLSSLIKYETQNELLEIVRQFIARQEELLKRTKQERQRSAFEGLLD